ncbi:MAG TPA: tripartite tricarboxylate transporter substrate-binding protein [Candidatus Binatia bacterium]
MVKSKSFVLLSLFLWLSASTLLGALSHLEFVKADTAHAQSKPFYEGKTVRVIVGPSGGYDYWARLLARYMPKYIAGNPSFVVQAMPGAGSVIATNYVYNLAQPDGLTVGMPTQQIYMGEFVGNDEVKFQMRKFLWIGSPDRNPAILYIRADTPYRTIDDVVKSKVPPKCGGTGWESSSLIVALEEALGAKFELVLGYQGANEVDLAVVRGEVVCRDLGLTAHFSREPFLSWHAKGFDRHLLQTGRKRDARAADTPTIFELMDRYKTPEVNRRAIEVLTAGEGFGHPMMAPPGTPVDRVKILREAYAQALRDPELIAEAQKGRWVIEPVSGEELQSLAERIMVQPPDVVNQVKKILRVK